MIGSCLSRLDRVVDAGLGLRNEGGLHFGRIGVVCLGDVGQGLAGKFGSQLVDGNSDRRGGGIEGRWTSSGATGATAHWSARTFRLVIGHAQVRANALHGGLKLVWGDAKLGSECRNEPGPATLLRGWGGCGLGEGRSGFVCNPGTAGDCKREGGGDGGAFGHESHGPCPCREGFLSSPFPCVQYRTEMLTLGKARVGVVQTIPVRSRSHGVSVPDTLRSQSRALPVRGRTLMPGCETDAWGIHDDDHETRITGNQPG